MAASNKGPVVLLTDFGDKDAFVGIMKGVILSINPDAAIVDLNHKIWPQNIAQGAYVLKTAYPYFAPGSIFCCVVDPGVGSERNGLCIETNDYFFVGPDNGLLWPAVAENGIKRIIRLTRDEFFLDTVSTTFHGRDVFAPVSAAISKGLKDLSKLGETQDKCVVYEIPPVASTEKGLALTVIDTDHFGNIVLNMTADAFNHFAGNRDFVLTSGRVNITKKYRNYASAKDDEAFLVLSSSGFMEISVKNGSAVSKTDISLSDTLYLNLV